MTFNNSIAQWLAGTGIPAVYFANINVNTNVSVLLPTTGSFPPIQPRAGYVRIKDTTAGAPPANTNILIGGIYATYVDGNTSNIYAGDPGKSQGGRIVDATFFFWFDRPVANINVTNITADGPTRRGVDIEFAGMM